MKIIDAHNHPDWHGHNFERFIENMDRFGIAQTCLMPWESPPNEYTAMDCLPAATLSSTTGPIPFSRCLNYKERAPDRIILGYTPDPRNRDAIQALKAAVKIYDVKFCGELKVRMLCDNPDALNLFNACSELKLPVIIHLDYDSSNLGKDHAWYGGTIESFERAIKACPDTCFLGHAPGFWKHISGDSANLNNSVKAGGHIPRMLRLYDNLYCDISAGSGFNALNRDHEFAIDFLTEFQDRIVFARDCFDNKHQELIKSLLLPDQVTSKIFSKNITKLLSI